MTSTIVYVARHGETEWNALGRLQGHTDVPLSDKGRSQARSLAAQLAEVRISAVVTSDLLRARETGQVVGEILGVAEPPIVDPDLRERRFGVFEGLTRDECVARYGDAWRRWREESVPPEGGETNDEVVRRFNQAMARAARLGRAPGDVLVVAHGAAMRMWLSSVVGRPLDPIGNVQVFEVAFGERIHAAPWPDGWLP